MNIHKTIGTLAALAGVVGVAITVIEFVSREEAFTEEAEVAESADGAECLIFSDAPDIAVLSYPLKT